MNLKDLRRAVPLNQHELAVKLGVSDLTVSSWEIARRHPKPVHIRALADALGVDARTVLAAIEETQKARDVATDARPGGAGDSLAAPSES